MSKKNSKKNHQKMRNTAMAREEEEAAKKAARAAKRAAQAAEAAGEMAVDNPPTDKSSDAKTSGKKKKVSYVKALGAKGAVHKKALGLKGVSDKKGLGKVVRGVRVGHVMKKVKLRKNAVVRGIKIVDADTKRAVVDELKAEAALALVGGGAMQTD